jgi:hypothetical protein
VTATTGGGAAGADDGEGVGLGDGDGDALGEADGVPLADAESFGPGPAVSGSDSLRRRTKPIVAMRSTESTGIPIVRSRRFGVHARRSPRCELIGRCRSESSSFIPYSDRPI